MSMALRYTLTTNMVSMLVISMFAVSLVNGEHTSLRKFNTFGQNNHSGICAYLGFDDFNLTIRQGKDLTFNASQLVGNITTCGNWQTTVSLEILHIVPIFLNWTFASTQGGWKMESFVVGFDDTPLTPLNSSIDNVHVLTTSWECTTLDFVANELPPPVNVSFFNVLIDPFILSGNVTTLDSTVCGRTHRHRSSPHVTGVVAGAIVGALFATVVVVVVARKLLIRNNIISSAYTKV
eukprot:m.34087 g.34087  ORF g.34087 m.34087 type:complete len:236 (+) comp16927_c0_seq1:141-848(+)